MPLYQSISKIGEGTFSEVFRVQEVHSRQIYASKCLKRRFKTSWHVSNFREIKALRSLSDHPNIIRLIDVLYDSRTGRLALIFELLDLNLYDFIKDRTDPVPLKLVRNWLFQILLALEFMHNMGVFHRDVKPENLMISGSILKVADLGSCKSVKSSPPHTDYISTRWYRAPECLLTDGYYSKEMDIWATGCVMYEVITLQPLFPGQNEIDQLDLIHQTFGTPSISDIRSMFGTRASAAAQAEMRLHGGEGLQRKFSQPMSDPQLFNLLNLLLLYDYRKRITASDALSHRTFLSNREDFHSTMYVILLFSYTCHPILENTIGRLRAQCSKTKSCRNLFRNSTRFIYEVIGRTGHRPLRQMFANVRFKKRRSTID